MLPLLRRRRYRLLLLGLLALLLWGAILFALRPSSAPSAAGFYPHLQRGMTRAEVETVLGGPPGDYYTQDRTRATSVLRPLGPKPPEWFYDDGYIVVYFGDDDRCVRASLVPLRPRHTWYHRLLDPLATWF